MNLYHPLDSAWGQNVEITTKGKYRFLWNDFQQNANVAELQQSLGRIIPNHFGQLKPTERNQVFYDLAPIEVKIQLSAKFPKEFGQRVGEVLEDGEVLNNEARHILNRVSLLRADYRETVLNALAGYIVINAQSKSLPPQDVAKVLELATNQRKNEQAIPLPTTTEEVIQSAEGIRDILKQSQSEDPEIRATATELLQSLTEGYYSPLVKRDLYKDTALFWSALSQNQGVYPSPKILSGFVEAQANQRTAVVYKAVDPIIRSYFDTQVLPTVYEDFAETATYAPDIKYFKNRDPEGNPKFLFLHQVEAIRYLEERGGGILADEPGTGKTVELALFALKMLDQKDIPSDRPGRTLVVGTKSVADNWEMELNKHLETEQISIDNVTFAEDGSASGGDLTRRIRQLRLALQFPGHNRQFVLVNYDIFRHPDFRQILQDFDFDIGMVDEAHNVKSRFLDSILDPEARGKGRVAQRTDALYHFLKEEGRIVALATSTPFVKELVEPLIMVHLVDPNLLPAENIRTLTKDVAGTNRLVRLAMIRRRKEEIADLPAKKTMFFPLNLNSLSEQDRNQFIKFAEELLQRHDGQFAQFYSLLALEAQAKFPWLLNKVNELIAQDRKIIIFTPFTSLEDTLTASISTRAIASRLRSAGISGVAVLDGKLSNSRRIAVQDSFLKPGGVQIIVGNYQVAGESLTLCSPQNRATEVILYIGPDTISRYINAVDRVHRFGQSEKVTIHIPYLTGDPLGREQGTYDERVIRRLREELNRFTSVIDSPFFVESGDYFAEIAKSIEAEIDKDIVFDYKEGDQEGLFVRPKAKRRAGGGRRGRRRFQPDELDQEVEDIDEFEEDLIEMADEEEAITIKTRALTGIDNWINEEEKDAIGFYISQAQRYPLLNSEQAQLLFKHFKKRSSIEDLKQDELFAELFDLESNPRMGNAFADSRGIRDIIANCNIRLVISAARGWGGLPLLDKIQEGNIGLLTAIEKFDPDLGYQFSTYALHWIRQGITRGIADTGRLIRLPVHVNELLSKTRTLRQQFQNQYYSDPNPEEFKAWLIHKGGFAENEANTVVGLSARGVSRVVSLDTTIDTRTYSPGSIYDTTSLGDFLVDETVNVEAEAIGEEATVSKEEVELALDKLLPRERVVMEYRHGLKDGKSRTLEEVGKEFGITRERIRQIEAKAMKKLRQNRRLRQEYLQFARVHNPDETVAEKSEIEVEIKPLSETESIDKVKKNRVLWDLLSAEDRRLLTLYQRTPHRELLADRLAKIYGTSSDEILNQLDSTLEHATSLVVT